ncbi:GNAT family N-acetyltransferase [Paenibacillus swuensis]|uniref:GNAT family N-acetyltransferase n=1 Tax=Paenibacillus swuensis TaxID=1178515 RepID=UPI0009EF24FF|nr:GNAT family N-acetyltransferase [Paenibacillus swuensis]
MEWKKGLYKVSDSGELLDIDFICRELSKSYWASDRVRGSIVESVRNSLSFGLYDVLGKQIGYARVVTDKVVFSWICDVIVHEDYRGRGLGKWLMSCVLDHPDVKQTKQRLATRDAHGLYERFGFVTDEMMTRKT